MRNPWLWRSDKRAFGRVAVRGTSIQAAVIYQRWRAGETVEEIANDYGLSAFHVVAAINFDLGSRDRRTREWRAALEDES